MKQILLFLGIIFLAFNVGHAKKLYVEMEYSNNSIKLDDGSNKKPQAIKGENGKNLKFKSLVGALNYMSLQGWELLGTKPLTKGHTIYGSGSTETKVYFIFCKDVSDDELMNVVNAGYKD